MRARACLRGEDGTFPKGPPRDAAADNVAFKIAGSAGESSHGCTTLPFACAYCHLYVDDKLLVPAQGAFIGLLS